MEIIALEVATVLVLVVLNGVFSMSELAVVSARRARLQPMADKGHLGARAAIELADEPRAFLSTVQIGITLVGILAGAFGGATISNLLAEQLARVPGLAGYAATISFLLVVLAITYLSIVLGELIPKSFALSAPEKIAIAVSRPMRLLSRAASPVVWLLSTPTSAVLRLFKVHASVEPPVTDEEIISLIDAGTKAGVFEKTEQDMFESVIHLGDQRVTTAMTPRTRVAWLDLDDPAETLKAMLAETPYSRLPVGRGRLDNIQGYVSAKGLLHQLAGGRDLDVLAAVRQPIYVPESVTVLELLETFRASATHLAVVVDEHGGVEGLVTMHDLLEVIVGEIERGPHAAADPRVTQGPDGSIVVDGRLPVEELAELIGAESLAEGGEGKYQTAAGFVLSRFSSFPRAGDRFRFGEQEFVVDTMDGHRVSKIRITRDPPSA
jgi:putative hemolysin